MDPYFLVIASWELPPRQFGQMQPWVASYLHVQQLAVETSNSTVLLYFTENTFGMALTRVLLYFKVHGKKVYCIVL